MHDYFDRLFPNILDVLRRDQRFWSNGKHFVRKAASMNNFCYILGGQGSLEILGQTYPLKRDDVFHFCVGQQFHLRSDPDDTLCYIAVHYQPYVVPVQAGMPLEANAVAWPFAPMMSIGKEQKELPVLMESLLHCWTNKNAGFEWKARVMLLNIFQKLSDWYGQIQQDENARLIAASMEHIKQNFHEKLERDGLAQMIAVSSSYYSVLFKRYSGYSVVQYITKLRIDRAKQLLTASKAPVSEIAREVGYTDPLYFARKFSQEIGMSPSEYRNS
ncbi:AraC family transcriptional regulator [Paenibacillus agricola]|uniref:AraC family transcriptional regulator n=1 Tax=Paenibacillus agricola TaxID=2716264 RepID=A0ABX0J0V6_9BACL|nr:AraC family transcriptional regulator [Paenibacillus agricola]NHN29603.1 AraC family transcriptional regulator [Paenibacillus agricola]